MMGNIQEMLFYMADGKYKQFQCRLIPNISPQEVIGESHQITPEQKAYLKFSKV